VTKNPHRNHICLQVSVYQEPVAANTQLEEIRTMVMFQEVERVRCDGVDFADNPTSDLSRKLAQESLNRPVEYTPRAMKKD